jgi:zinc-ribbon domain
LRCGRCGNENDDGNRFCGMCGATLVGSNQAAGRGASAGAAGSGSGRAERGGSAERSPTAVSAAESRSSKGRSSDGRSSDGRSSDARADAWPSTRPVISGGPSLLGLNLPGSAAGSGHGDGGRDPLRPSSSVEYLLEDDEEESHRSWGKMILIALALALAVGFGYLRWKGVAGFDWISGGDQKPPVVAQTPDAGQSSADSTAAPAGGTAAPDGAGGAVSAPANSGAGSGTGPAESGAPQAAASQTSPQDTASQSAPAQSTPAQTAAQNADQQSVPQSDSGAAAPAADSDQPSPPVETAHRTVARKPPAAVKPATKPLPPVDSVTEAERYIYGRGVGQDCDRGLRLLKAGAQSNVRAMISMGALYSTGTCTPRDLPTAYRWFALALHKEPDNQALQNDLQSLWSKMTPPERQLAIKLSQ